MANTNFNVFTTKEEIKRRIPEGVYTFTVARVTSNPEGPNVQLFLTNEEYSLTHTIFPKNIPHHRNNIGEQLDMKGKHSLMDVLKEAKGKALQVRISYNQYGRNVSFDVRNTSEENEEVEASTDVPF